MNDKIAIIKQNIPRGTPKRLKKKIKEATKQVEVILNDRLGEMIPLTKKDLIDGAKELMKQEPMPWGARGVSKSTLLMHQLKYHVDQLKYAQSIIHQWYLGVMR